ncbi:hypothetical protein ABW16_21405 [Mycolicibacter heraklionensis]|uniref:Uncharacterized protein n=1 Tax=Mycolicibacter heraklionensis TaxID=512402 RepID=A0ABR5FA39_9MYCO|nr:hypothetical protein [Mycolicibacter heraklionensis]KLO25876.1 hypothetical protein ABW16_21405 [Mycolicibacter heraklionensis]
MSLSISKPAYDLAARVLGPTAETWLNTERLGLGDAPDVPTTARKVLQSGCPACIDTVIKALEQIEKDSQ